MIGSAPAVRRIQRLRGSFILGLVVVGAAAGSKLAQPTDSLTRFTYTEYHMGVDTRLVVYAPNEGAAIKACTAAFSRIADLDTMMSDYRIRSELNRLSDAAGGPPMKVSAELFRVLERAQWFSQLSRGAFDVTIGPLVQLWRKARKTGKLPAKQEIAIARSLVGWKMMRLDARRRTVELERKGMRLDLGAIAKGYADDEAQRVLRRHGISRALVEMGGDIVVSGPPPGTKGWTVSVPNAGNDAKPLDMQLAHCAISSSGDTEQNVVIGGVRYSHVVDPHTGYALTSRVQATVICKDGLTSDPLSTSLTLVDARSRAALLRACPGSRAFVRSLD